MQLQKQLLSLRKPVSAASARVKGFALGGFLVGLEERCKQSLPARHRREGSESRFCSWPKAYRFSTMTVIAAVNPLVAALESRDDNFTWVSL